jgi:hypothetical protein
VKLGAAAAIALIVAAVASAAPNPLRKFDMQAFFTGRTRTENVMKVVLRGPVPLIVDSVGKREGNAFVMIDTVHEGDKPVRERKWVTQEVSPGHYRGTLTDATGPVDIQVSGDSAIIRYTMKGGLNIEQHLQLQGDGRSLSNHVDARKFGLHFAHVDGTIRKLD